jgi:hypothetical protein
MPDDGWLRYRRRLTTTRRITPSEFMDSECYPRDARRVSLGPASYTFDTRARFLATPTDEFEPAIAEQWENNKAQLRQQLAN